MSFSSFISVILLSILLSFYIIPSLNAFSLPTINKSSWDLPESVVNITNSLPSGPPLVIHCASKDDDFGFHTLKRQETFSFTFKRNIFGRTLYFCHFWWGSKNVFIDVFKGYSCRNKASQVISECDYSAREDGIYLSYNIFFVPYTDLITKW